MSSNNHEYSGGSGGCSNCFQTTKYSPLTETNDFGCGPKCIDRFNKERSVKDMMYFNHFVLGKPMHLQPYTKNNRQWANHTYRENNTS